MSPPRGKKFVPLQAIILLLILAALMVQAKKAPKTSSGHNLERSLDDELIASYECPGRSRDWTVRCLVPTTNYQLTVDLCGTKKKPDKKLVEKCIRELYILSKSCPQPSMMEAAKEMLYHKAPPPPPQTAASPNSRFSSPGRNRPSSQVDAIYGLPVVGNPSKKAKGGKKKKKKSKDPFDL
uniref:Putative proline rich salivary secreted peptide n=1 Tax=Culex tarsalis TaxID=7177 RepID=A0A1Q3EUC5_CULTA